MQSNILSNLRSFYIWLILTVMPMIACAGDSLTSAATFQEQKQALLEEIARNPDAIAETSEALKADKEVVLMAVRAKGGLLEYASDALKADPEVALAAMQQNHVQAWKFVSKSLIQGINANKAFVMDAVRIKPVILREVAEKFKGDQELVLAAVQKNGVVLRYASEALKSNKQVVSAAVKENGLALEFASEHLKADKDIVLLALSTKYATQAFQFVATALKEDREVIMTLVSHPRTNILYYLALAEVATKFRNDKDIVLAAVGCDGRELVYASETLRVDQEIVKTAFQTCPRHPLCALASKETSDLFDSERDLSAYLLGNFLADKEIVIAAMQNYALSLEFVPDQLRADKEVVLAAVQQNGRALAYASEELRGDKAVVLAAVQKFGNALRYASEALKGDEEVVLAAVQENRDVLKYSNGVIQDRLFADREFVLSVLDLLSKSEASDQATTAIFDGFFARIFAANETLNTGSFGDKVSKLALLQRIPSDMRGRLWRGYISKLAGDQVSEIEIDTPIAVEGLSVPVININEIIQEDGQYKVTLGSLSGQQQSISIMANATIDELAKAMRETTELNYIHIVYGFMHISPTQAGDSVGTIFN